MADVTFRDFAAAIMQNDAETARQVLATLLDLPPEPAAAATSHFAGRMTDPAFLPKAMSLRTAVTTGSDAEISTLLEDCFGLDGEARTDAVAAIRRRYPAA